MDYIVNIIAHQSYTSPTNSTKNFIVSEEKLHDFLLSFIKNFKQNPNDPRDVGERFGKDIKDFFKENKLTYMPRDYDKFYEFHLEECITKNTNELITYLTHKNTDTLIEFIQTYCQATTYTDVLNELEIVYIVEMGRNVLLGNEQFIEYTDQEINEDLICD